MVVKLVVLKGKAKGREIPLPYTQFVIGRGASCHLRPHSDLVSKLHCAIARQPGGKVAVRDLKSRNCTYVNDQPIKGTIHVKDGDILSVGPLQFQFLIISEELGAPVSLEREENLHWLLDEPTDTFEVDAEAETAVIEIPPHLMEENGESAHDNRLTVGKYLREYYQTKKNGDTGSIIPAASVDLRKEQLQFVDRLLNRVGRNTPSLSRDEIVCILIDAIAQKGLDLAEIETPDDLRRILAEKIR
ncbi:MAG: FHA domain-containing protein [Planctomycetes bacterium]|nr:FHA domain-containing protein [Planctomycetota bacterium]